MKSLKIKRLNENAILPERASAGAAGMDLHACIPSPVTIAPRELVRIPTGLADGLRVRVYSPEQVFLGLGIVDRGQDTLKILKLFV